MVEFSEEDLGERGRVRREGTVGDIGSKQLPDVTLPSTAGREVSLKDEVESHHLVLVLYPGDLEGLQYPELMGCTPQACSVRDNLATIEDLEAKAYGVSFQTTDRQHEFVEREELNYELLSDANEELATALDLPVWMSEDGGRFVYRLTIIARKGDEITHVIENPTVEIHADEVIDRLRSLTASEHQ